MLNLLPATPELNAARTIAKTLRAGGFQAFFAGGCVRDLLLGLIPKDFDVATDATPAQVASLFARTEAVGAHFGVMLVQLDGCSTEVATFRHDGVYLDGRRPDSVQFSLDPEEDVRRRDFTINGMLLEPETGAVLDFVGGRKDLSSGVVRTIGSPLERFGEDKLRMLRGVRFAARLGFALDPATADAMRTLAPEIAQVSNERVRDELTRMLTEGHARRAIELLSETGLLAEVLPEAEKMRGVEQPPDWHPEGDVWVHTLLLLDHLPAGAAPMLAWGMLLHDIGKPATSHFDRGRWRFNGHVEVGMRIAETICARLRFSNDDTAQIVELVRHHMQFGSVADMKQSTLKRFVRLPHFEQHLALHYADCMSCHGKLGMYELAKTEYERDETPAERPPLLVTGRDLIAAGYRPGPAFKAMLLAAEDAQLEGRIATTDEGLSLIAATNHDANL